MSLSVLLAQHNDVTVLDIDAAVAAAAAAKAVDDGGGQFCRPVGARMEAGGRHVRMAERGLPRDGRRAWARFARLCVHGCLDDVSQKDAAVRRMLLCVYVVP